MLILQILKYNKTQEMKCNAKYWYFVQNIADVYLSILLCQQAFKEKIKINWISWNKDHGLYQVHCIHFITYVTLAERQSKMSDSYQD